jgi:sigma-B regulation protein RsbU (phosphoserine phosphatase)
LDADAARPAGEPADKEALFDHAACGLIVTRDDGTFVLVNHTFCAWLGCDAPSLVGRRRLQDLLTMGARIFHQTHWSPLLQIQGSIGEVKLDLLHRDGHVIPMIMNAVRRTSDGVVRHEIAVFVAEDRSRYERELLAARKRAEELLRKEREAQQALAAVQVELDLQRVAAEDRATFAEQMVGIVSHDLRNPIAAIQLSAALLGRGELTPRQGRALEAISNSVARSKRLIEDLLDFTEARIGRGLRVTPRPLRLHEFIAQVVGELRVLFPGRMLVHVAGDGEVCSGDEDRLAQLLGNLVSNAMAYGDPVAPVTVSTEVGAERAVLAVHNHGHPIRAEALPTLFDAMTRGKDGTAASAPHGHSVGLGLFIVRQIARAHGGDVTVASSADAGTTFTVTLPR